jgi:hypothetical protein
LTATTAPPSLAIIPPASPPDGPGAREGVPRLAVFLSYSSKDLATAEGIRDALIARGLGA